MAQAFLSLPSILPPIPPDVLGQPFYLQSFVPTPTGIDPSPVYLFTIG